MGGIWILEVKDIEIQIENIHKYIAKDNKADSQGGKNNYPSNKTRNAASYDNQLSHSHHEILEKITQKDFKGKWKVQDLKDKLSKHLHSSSGTAYLKIYYEKEKNPHSLRMYCVLYDGKHRDVVVYLNIKINRIEVSKLEDTEIIFHDERKSSVRKTHSELFSSYSDYECLIDDAVGTFILQSDNNFLANLMLESSGKCFPGKLEISIDSTEGSFKTNKHKVLKYSLIFSLFLLLCCFWTYRQWKEVQQNEDTAKYISIVSLSWNIIWNYCCCCLHLNLCFQFSEYGYLIIPTCMYIVLWFIFQLKFLYVWWKAKNSDLFLQGNKQPRKALIWFYIKFYLIALGSLILFDYIIYDKYALLLFSSLMLFPQILFNTRNKSSDTPNISYAIINAITQGFFPLYIRGCPKNFFELKHDMKWAIVLIFIIFIQIVVLVLQRKWGPRFWIPKNWRFFDKNRYQTQKDSIP